MGLTAAGWTRKRLSEILQELQDAFVQVFGEINWNADSVFSQMVAILADREALLEEKMEDIYLSQYRASAEGTSLDQVVALVGLTRLAAAYTQTIASLIGTTGTVVPLGTLFSILGTAEQFASLAAQTIEAADCNQCRIRAAVLGDGLTWSVTINGTVYLYTDPGGGGFPTELGVAQLLEPVITADGNRVMNAVAVADGGSTGYIQLTSTDEVTGYTVTVNVNNGIDTSPIASPVNTQASNLGEVLALADTLTTIVTPVAGLSSVNNPTEGDQGRDTETDLELRQRAQIQLATIGASTVESIRSQILQLVDNVTSCQVYENETTSLDTIVITFDADFVTANSTVITYNGGVLAAVPFNADSDTTQQDIADAIAGEAEVSTAVIVGTPTRTITITPVNGEYVLINSAVTTGGASQPDAAITGDSRPAKSIEVIAEGGTDVELAEQIWESKPAGIQTHGFDSELVVDSMGVSHGIEFTRPFDLEYYLHIEMTYNTEETFPTDGQLQVANDVLLLADTEVGEDVILQKFIPAIYETPGIATAVLTWDLVGGGGPYSGTENIPVSESQLAKLILTRITTNIS